MQNTNGRSYAILAATVLVLSRSASIAQMQPLKIGDGSDWRFVTSQWKDQDGQIVGSKTGDGDGLQGYCLAFNKKLAYSDVQAEFTVCMQSGHADIGLIVRAQDPTHYYLIHFPQCGQGYRAQHFWAAVSKADGSGYLRLLKVQLVPRVASNPFGIAHKCRVKVEGNRIQAWLNGFPAIDVTDDTYKAGYVGLGGFERSQHGTVSVGGEAVQVKPFDGNIPQVKNWFVPFSGCGTQQGSVSLVKTRAGTILCSFSSSTGFYLARSSDGGKSWELGKAPDHFPGGLTLLKDGRLVGITLSDKGGEWSESDDDGKTWSTAAQLSIEKPPTLKAFETGWPLQLTDGTLIRFGLGGAVGSAEANRITQWGAVHTQAFSTRSTDGGKTWSKPTNLDTDRPEMGNLDLTEPVAFETRDGRIMCLIRPIYSPWMWETWSTDKGKSWGPCVRGPFAGWAPSAPVRTQNGAVVFPTRFPGLTLHATRDDGLTWDTGTYIDTSIWAMGALCEIEPNVVLFLYMDSWRDKIRGQFFQMTPGGPIPIRPPA